MIRPRRRIRGTPAAAHTDNRPRVGYTLPDGRSVAIIFDVGEQPPAALSYLVGSEIVTAVRAEVTS